MWGLPEDVGDQLGPVADTLCEVARMDEIESILKTHSH